MAPHRYVESLRTAEIHWLFVQGEQALKQGLFLPATIALLTGIEASIRFTLLRLDRRPPDDELGETLSNEMIRRAGLYGLPIHAMAFPDEWDFLAKIAAGTPHAEIVHLRWNLIHGNVSEFVRHPYEMFNPECLRRASSQLLTISENWVELLAGFKRNRVPVGE